MTNQNIELVTRRSLLYKSEVEYADYCINHVGGCAHGCTSPCYAFLMAKRAGRVRTYEEWRRPKLVANALELLDKEIPRFRRDIKSVHLCFTTDPFMYGYEQVTEMTLKIIAKLHANGIKCTTLTKGITPSELTRTEEYGSENEYGITLVSLNPDFRERFERGSAPYQERVSALRRLHEAGLRTWVSMEPYPTPNLVEQRLEDVLQAIDFADRIVFGKLNYSKDSNRYPKREEFYQEAALAVKDFCRTRRKECHIKGENQ